MWLIKAHNERSTTSIQVSLAENKVGNIASYFFMLLDYGYPKLDPSGGIAGDVIGPRCKGYLFLTRDIFFKN